MDEDRRIIFADQGIGRELLDPRHDLVATLEKFFEALFADPMVERAMVQVSNAEELTSGVGIEQVTVAAIMNTIPETNEGASFADADHARSWTELLLRVPCQVLLLNADDPACMDLRDQGNAKQLCLVGLDPSSPALVEHLEGGQPVITLKSADDGDWIVLRSGPETSKLDKINPNDDDRLGQLFSAGLALHLGDANGKPKIDA